MPFRFLIHIPRGALRLLLWTILLVMLAFFGATRTQIGRDAIKNRVERAFAQRFEGQLRIGSLSGNLMYRVVATGVQLYDDRGAPVGSIDSVVVNPRWRRLAQGYLEFGRFYLYDPNLHLVRDTSGTWNILRAVTPRVTSDSSEATSIKSVAIGDLRILSGEVVTSNEADRPSLVTRGAVFDYTNATFGIRDAHFTVNWSPQQGQVDVVRMSARIAEPNFEATRLEGQFLFEEGRYLVNQLSLETPNTRLSGHAAFEPDRRLAESSEPYVELRIDALPLDNNEIKRLFPMYPLRSRLELAARIQGPLSALVVEELSGRHGASRLSASGTLVGLPDSLDFDVSVTNGRLRPRSVAALVPALDIRRWTDADSLVLSVLGRGVVRDPFGTAWNGSGDFFLDLSGDAGQVSGRVSISGSRGGVVTLTSDLVTNRFDVSRALPTLGLPANLSGDVSVDAGGRGLDDIVASVELDLIASTVRGITVDSLRAFSTYDANALAAEALVASHGGTASLTVAADFTASPARYALGLRTKNLDVGPLIASDSLSSSLNGDFTARFVMSDWSDLQGELEVRVDSSLFVSGDAFRAVPPAQLSLKLEVLDRTHRIIDVRGDAGEANLQVHGHLASIDAATNLWKRAFLPDGAAAADSAATTRDFQGRSDTDGEGLSEPPVELYAVVNRIDPRLLTSFLPGFPPIDGDFAGELRITATDSVLTARGNISGDSLLFASFHARNYSASIDARTTYQHTVEQLQGSLEVTSDWYSFGGSGMPRLDVAANVARGTGTLAISSGRGLRLGPIDVQADLALERETLVLTPSRFSMTARGIEWSLVTASPIEIRAGALRSDRLVFSSRGDQVAEPQQIEVRGGISSNPDERLFARLERLDLAQVSNLLSLKANLGGRLSGTATLFKRESTPVLESALSIESLTLDKRVLGDVDLTSQLQPGSSTVLLDVEVLPAEDTLATPAVHNVARVTGNVLLPTFDRFGSPSDPGQFDLQASVERADMFFFEYIFPGTVRDVTGAVSGNVHITGTPSRPVFDAEFLLSNGRFLVPEFNLDMNIEGDVFVDKFGVHIRRAEVVDKTGGAAVISGDVLFNDYRYFSLNLYGQLDDFQIMNVASSKTLPFYGDIWGSGTVSLSGRLSATELRASTVRTSPRSELYIPLVKSQAGSDGGFIIFADSVGQIPDLTALTRRRNVLASRPQGERGFTEGMDIEINIDAPEGSTVHLVIDPLLGDVINGIGSGRVQILRKQGEFQTFGTFQVNSGDYLFTAGEVFVRRFVIEEGGLITWDGDPTDALLDIPAAFRTRASRAGLGTSTEGSSPLIPVVVNLRITGRVSAPQVALSLAIDRSAQDLSSSSDREFLETILNDPQQSTEYATSVLLTNSFALTTTTSSGGEALGTGAFNSLSQLIATQLNRYLSSALPNVDFSFGVQGESGQQLDITYGVALRLLDERLVIRGEGVYQGAESAANESLQGEFVVEVRLSNNVSVEVFYRREGDALAAERILTSTTGAGVSYRTEFPTWRRFFSRLFGWLFPDKREPERSEGPVAATTSEIDQ